MVQKGFEPGSDLWTLRQKMRVERNKLALCQLNFSMRKTVLTNYGSKNTYDFSNTS